MHDMVREQHPAIETVLTTVENWPRVSSDLNSLHFPLHSLVLLGEIQVLAQLLPGAIADQPAHR